ncbi:MAG: 5-deoxy-glucuronate isomerase [Acidobacteria bacterium]|nr:MAG: 5-deoxy-glucuronate isomerase [Acidobacteriota bacterium]
MLSDTLYRVPRQRGLSMIQSRGPAHARELTSRRLVLDGGQSARFDEANEETVLVLQEGAGELAAGGKGWNVSRTGVFSERATALYLPAGAALSVTATSRMEAILISTPATARGGAEPVLVGPEDVRVNVRGRDHYTREVHDLFVDDPYAARLMVGETFNPPGNWSSYPPHKHDGADGEPRLEEVYHFRIAPAHGFAHQSLYTAAGECVTHQVRDGDAVLLPYGYHPVSAPPGYRVYYLWALAGEQRHLVPYEDPQHRWIHDAANVEHVATSTAAARRAGL